MALSKTVTKKSVKYIQERLFIITFNLIVTEGAIEVINQDFTCEYRTGDTPTQKVNEIKEKMQKTIDNYKTEQQIFNAAALDTAINQIQSALIL